MKLFSYKKKYGTRFLEVKKSLQTALLGSLLKSDIALDTFDIEACVRESIAVIINTNPSSINSGVTHQS